MKMGCAYIHPGWPLIYWTGSATAICQPLGSYKNDHYDYNYYRMENDGVFVSFC